MNGCTVLCFCFLRCIHVSVNCFKWCGAVIAPLRYVQFIALMNSSLHYVMSSVGIMGNDGKWYYRGKTLCCWLVYIFAFSQCLRTCQASFTKHVFYGALSVSESSTITHQRVASVLGLSEHQSHTSGMKEAGIRLMFHHVDNAPVFNTRLGAMSCFVCSCLCAYAVAQAVFQFPPPCRNVTIFWHTVKKKQFPVCKCPVYTLVLQSLSPTDW